MKLKNFSPTTARRLILALFVALLTMTAQAADFDVIANSVTWSCTIKSGTNVSIVPANKSAISGSVTIPASVTYSATNYTVTSIGISAFEGTGLTSITIPASVTGIGANAFKETGLTSVNFETDSQLTNIGNGAFYLCSNLTSITIPASVTTIGQDAFRETGLNSITIPVSVTTIGQYAFQNCSNLASVIVNRITAGAAPDLGSNAFDGNAAVRKIYYSPTSYSSFSSKWSIYADDLVGIPEVSEGMNITANQDPENFSVYWCTYYNPTYSMQVSSGVTIYKARVNGDKTKVILTEVAGNTITVGQAVVLKKYGSNNTITLSQKLEAAGDYSGNELKGGSTVQSGYDAYTLSGKNEADEPMPLGFYKFTGSSLNAYKAHLELPQTLARGYIGFDGDDGSTAIEAPEVASDSDDGDIYDLMGRKVVGQPKKGIYVKRGRKFIVK